MKKLTTAKLALARETVHLLSAAHLAVAHGGGTTNGTPLCVSNLDCAQPIVIRASKGRLS